MIPYFTNLCGRYLAGSVPVSASKSMASLMRRMLSPRFLQRFICLSKLLVVLMVYFIP